MKNSTVKNVVLSAFFLALGIILPSVFAPVQAFGQILQPMHYPVYLCALICGWKYGAAIGFLCPLLRSSLFGMPVFYPTAIAMAFELASYGLVAGLIFSRERSVPGMYLSLVCAMALGRIVWGCVTAILLSLNGGVLLWETFIASAVTSAIPGILMQLVLIPAIVVALSKAKMIAPVSWKRAAANA